MQWHLCRLGQQNAGPADRRNESILSSYACDEAVLTLLRAHTLGNSPTALQHNLHELHSEDWLRRQLRYLTDCQNHHRGLTGLCINVLDYPQPSPFSKAQWLLAVYVTDVWTRLPALLAQLTSIYGRVLKIDSTKKIVNKLVNHHRQ